MRNRKNHLAGLLSVVTAVSFAAACSSSASSKSVAAQPSGSSSGPSSSGSTAASGTPITLGGFGPIDNPANPLPQIKAGELAAVDAINAAGGVNGHPLKLDYCDSKGDANGEFSCMRQLVGEKVVAVVAPEILSDVSGRSLQYANAAKVPVIGNQGLLPAEFNTPGVFPTGAGIPGWAYGQAASIVKAGAKKIALFGSTDPSSVFILQLSQDGLASAHITPVRWVKQTSMPIRHSYRVQLRSSPAASTASFSMSRHRRCQRQLRRYAEPATPG